MSKPARVANMVLTPFGDLSSDELREVTDNLVLKSEIERGVEMNDKAGGDKTEIMTRREVGVSTRKYGTEGGGIISSSSSSGSGSSGIRSSSLSNSPVVAEEFRKKEILKDLEEEEEEEEDKAFTPRFSEHIKNQDKNNRFIDNNSFSFNSKSNSCESLSSDRQLGYNQERKNLQKQKPPLPVSSWTTEQAQTAPRWDNSDGRDQRKPLSERGAAIDGVDGQSRRSTNLITVTERPVGRGVASQQDGREIGVIGGSSMGAVTDVGDLEWSGGGDARSESQSGSIRSGNFHPHQRSLSPKTTADREKAALDISNDYVRGSSPELSQPGYSGAFDGQEGGNSKPRNNFGGNLATAHCMCF